MNQYGWRAQKHWQQWLPSRFQALPDPATFFDQLGEEIATRVDELSQALQGQDPPGEQYLQKLGRLNMARLTAEAQAMQELALFDPETEDSRES
jgi:hypothetical protein